VNEMERLKITDEMEKLKITNEFIRNLDSFNNHPQKNSICHIYLAKSGFYYDGNDIICRTCNVKLGNWKNTDDINVRHKFANPECPRVKFINISDSFKLIGKHPIIESNKQYATYKQRLESFKGYEQYFPSIKHVEMIADAGFYYFGTNPDYVGTNPDSVRCFTCDLCLSTFLDKDIPLQEHKKWAIDSKLICPFLIYLEHQSTLIYFKTYTGDIRVITQYKDLPIMHIIYDMGYSRQIVRHTIEKLVNEYGEKSFLNIEILLENVILLQDANIIVGDKLILNSTIPKKDNPKQPDIDIRDQQLIQSVQKSLQNNDMTNFTDSRLTMEEQINIETITSNNDMTNFTDSRLTMEEQINIETITLNDDITKLLEENDNLKEARQCKICLDNEVNTVFLPCGHMVACDQCAPVLRNCTVCRAVIRGTVKVILA